MKKASKRILVTGAAGFIGFHLTQALLKRGHPVLGIDNLNAYYDPALKQARLSLLNPQSGFEFRKLDLADRARMQQLFAQEPFSAVAHIGAQAGVRHSLNDPLAYVDSNLSGFAHVLEGCRHGDVDHLLFASSSSVYGANARLPWSVNDNVDHPVSLYAASKKANELMAHSYAHLYGLPCTGLRFFTVYGPWGRPDMAYYKFTRAILAGEPIEVYDEGRMQRDFTYVDDVIHAILSLLETSAQPDPQWDPMAPRPDSSKAPYRIYNIGNHSPVGLGDFIATLESALGAKATKIALPMQPGDVPATYADVDSLQQATGFAPSTPLADGLARFVAWYRQYHGV